MGESAAARRTPARERIAAALTACGLGSLLLLSGCQGLSGLPGSSVPSNEIDPLTGGPPLPRTAPNQPTSPPLGTAVATNSTDTPPPLPAPSAVTSPAALTTGANPTLTSGQDLRITPAPGTLGAPTQQWNNTPAPSSGAVLNVPQPIQDPNRGSPPPLAAPPASPMTNVALTGGTLLSGGDVYQQLQDALAARGVTWQSLETIDTGEWRFICSVPNRQNPNIGRRYEARGRTGPDAMRAVLSKIDREQQTGGY
jgi:hypothetical protein